MLMQSEGQKKKHVYRYRVVSAELSICTLIPTAIMHWSKSIYDVKFWGGGILVIPHATKTQVSDVKNIYSRMAPQFNLLHIHAEIYSCLFSYVT